MRILAISDIHGMIDAVRRLVQMDHGALDAVVIAGDIGGFAKGEHRRPANDVMAVLAQLGCPLLYIYGNWDHPEPYDRCYGPLCHHLHMNPYHLGDFTFIGFSGCPTNWGCNPIAQNEDDSKEIVRRNTEAMAAKIDAPAKTIVITHEKLVHVPRRIPGVPLLLYGHIHRFDDRTFRDARFIDVAALDKPVSYIRKGRGINSIRNVNEGTYCILQIEDGRIDVECRRLYPDLALPGWQRLEHDLFISARWIYGELEQTV